jgi:hypothetical protein
MEPVLWKHSMMTVVVFLSNISKYFRIKHIAQAVSPVDQVERVDPEGEDDENNDDILDGQLVLRHPRVVPILRSGVARVGEKATIQYFKPR